MAAQENAGANRNIFFNDPQITNNPPFNNPAGFTGSFNINTAPDWGYREYSVSNVPLPAYTAGEWFIYSFWARSDSDGEWVQEFTDLDDVTIVPSENSQGQHGPGNIYGNTAFQLTTQWTKYWVKIRLDVVRDKMNFFVLGRVGSQAVNVYIAGCKFEKGSIPTPWSEAEQLHNSSIDINTEGIDIKTGGKINMEAGGKLQMSAGSCKIDAADQSQSHIMFGNPDSDTSFQVDETGFIKARDARFNTLTVDSLSVGQSGQSGSEVLMLGVNVIKSDTQPSAHNALWIKPVGGGGTEVTIGQYSVITASSSANWSTTYTSGQMYYYPNNNGWREQFTNITTVIPITTPGLVTIHMMLNSNIATRQELHQQLLP